MCRFIFTICVSLLFLFESAIAEDDLRASLTLENNYTPTVTSSPLNLSGGSNVTLISPIRFSSLNVKFSEFIRSTHNQYERIFGKLPAINISLRLMDEEDFFKQTGAPDWTNALYLKNEILIPLSHDKRTDFVNIFRAIKHEYMHAVVNALSNGRCPGWLDEGLAQWAEGPENKSLRHVFIDSLNEKAILPFEKLQNGFTKLDPNVVPTAYAQSLYVTKELITQYGFFSIRNFFNALKKGYSKDAAFIIAFNMNEALFEVLSIRRLNQKFR